MDDSAFPPPERRNSTDLSAGKTQILNLDYNVAGMLCYLPICAVNLITSIIVLATEPQQNRFLRFHAMQSLFLTGIYVALGLVYGILNLALGWIPLLGGMLVMLLGLPWLIVTIAYIYKSVMGAIDAYKGRLNKIEYIGDMVEKRLAQ